MVMEMGIGGWPLAAVELWIGMMCSWIVGMVFVWVFWLPREGNGFELRA
jgi:hypothetical protein